MSETLKRKSKASESGGTAGWSKYHSGMVGLYALHFLLAGGLAIIFFIQGAMISVGITAGLLIFLLLSGSIGLVKRHPHYFYWYMSFCLIWVGWGLYHILWILGIIPSPVKDQILWIGNSLASKSTKNSNSSGTTRIPTANPTGTRPIGAQGVASRRPVVTNPVRRDFAEKVFSDVDKWRRNSDIMGVEIKNQNFKEFELVSRSHQLYPRQVVQTISPSKTNPVNTNDPMATTILPIIYGVHLLFLVVGFACVLLLPLISDDRRAIDDENPWGNMTAEEIATEHLKKDDKKKRATSIFHRMTYRGPPPQQNRDPPESEQNTLNNPANPYDRQQGFESFRKPTKGGESYKMNDFGGKDPYNKQPANYGGGYNDEYDNYSKSPQNYDRDTYYQPPALSPKNSKNKRDPQYDDRDTYYQPSGKNAPQYNDRDTYYGSPPPALSPKNSKNKRDPQYDDRDTYYQPSGKNAPQYNDRDTYYQPPSDKKGNMVPTKTYDGYQDKSAPPQSEIVRMKCTREYRPQLEDEVELLVNDLVDVEEQFEDGWGVGTNVATNEFGAFPLSCLSREVFDNQRRSVFVPADKGKKQRVQSLYGAKNAVDTRKKMGKETNKPGTGRPRDTMYNDYDETLDRGGYGRR